MPLLGNGCCITYYFVVVAYQRVYMSQYLKKLYYSSLGYDITYKTGQYDKPEGHSLHCYHLENMFHMCGEI
jgi:hypothetical protein